jgi:hypothetical protein
MPTPASSVQCQTAALLAPDCAALLDLQHLIAHSSAEDFQHLIVQLFQLFCSSFSI